MYRILHYITAAAVVICVAAAFILFASAIWSDTKNVGENLGQTGFLMLVLSVLSFMASALFQDMDKNKKSKSKAQRHADW